MAEYEASPLARDVGILCAQLHGDGRVDGVVAGLRAPGLVGDGAREVALGDAIDVAATKLTAPLRPFACSLADGAFVVVEPREVALADVSAGPRAAVDAAVKHAVKRYGKHHSDDFFALVAIRSGAR
jgi:hypothetical protein